MKTKKPGRTVKVPTAEQVRQRFSRAAQIRLMHAETFEREQRVRDAAPRLLAACQQAYRHRDAASAVALREAIEAATGKRIPG